MNIGLNHYLFVGSGNGGLKNVGQFAFYVTRRDTGASADSAEIALAFYST